MTDKLTAAERKAIPLCTGVLDYFPDALCEVARVSKVGNDQHNPGEPLHWAKEKSTDEADSLLRHLIDRGKMDADGVRHSAKVAWRALANLQREIDAEVAAAEQADNSEYRMLETGELIEATDQYRSNDGTWEPTRCVGMFVDKSLLHSYRRPIKPFRAERARIDLSPKVEKSAMANGPSHCTCQLCKANLLT